MLHLVIDHSVKLNAVPVSIFCSFLIVSAFPTFMNVKFLININYWIFWDYSVEFP